MLTEIPGSVYRFLSLKRDMVYAAKKMVYAVKALIHSPDSVLVIMPECPLVIMPECPLATPRPNETKEKRLPLYHCAQGTNELQGDIAIVVLFAGQSN